MRVIGNREIRWRDIRSIHGTTSVNEWLNYVPLAGKTGGSMDLVEREIQTFREILIEYIFISFAKCEVKL